MTLCRYVALRGACKMLKYSEIQRKRQSDIATCQKLLSNTIRPNGQNKSSRRSARKMQIGEGEVRQKVGQEYENIRTKV